MSDTNLRSRLRAFSERVWSLGRTAAINLRAIEAARQQRRFLRTLVAVTGSCGKTTTTTLIGTMLQEYGSSLTNLRNGGFLLYRALRKVRAPLDYYAQEVSGHLPGAIDKNTRRIRIDVAVVTSVGLDHASSFRASDLEVMDAIALEKGRLVERVRPGGLACLNFDDPRVRGMASRTRERVIGFGTAEDAEVRAVNVSARWPDRLRFDLVVSGATYPVTTRFVGTMMLTNILGALAVVHGLGLELDRAVSKLAEIEPVSDRMGVHAGRDGKTYILDAIKAPYWSTERLGEDLPQIAIPSLTFVVGDLSDIRNNSSSHYRKLLRRVSAEAETVVLAGRAAEYGAKLSGELDNLVIAPTAYDVATYLDTRPPGVVLIKSNKSLQLWRVLDQVTGASDVVA